MAVVLNTGEKSPDFSLEDQESNVVSLSSFRGKKVLLYFYPKADTPGCTTQSCAVSESLAVLKEAGVVAIGVSPDKPAAQKKFDNKYALGFPLLSDEDNAVANAYGAFGEKSMYGKTYLGVIRSSFLLDETGKLIGVWYKVSPGDTVPLAKKVLGLPL